MDDYALKNVMSLSEDPKDFLKDLRDYIMSEEDAPDKTIETVRDACIFWIMDRNKAQRGQ